MKRKFIPFLLMTITVLSLSACGSSGPKEAEYQWYDLYPHGLLTTEEREQRETIKQVAADSLPAEMRGDVSSISLKKQYVEVSISYSDEQIKSAPDEWPEAAENVRTVSDDLHNAIQASDDRPVVIYLTDSKQILLTTKDGELLYDRFKKAEKPKQREIDPETLARIEAESIARLKASGEYDRIMSAETSAGVWTVYVSRSNIIHSIPNCSGMISYREMEQGEADKMGYKYCKNCW